MSSRVRKGRAELPTKEFRGLFEAVIAVSLGFHVLIVSTLPSAGTTRAAVLPTFIEVGELPPAPAATPPAPDPKEEPAPEPVPRTAARATSKVTTVRAPAKEASTVTNPTSETADFTSTVLSSADGPGVAIPSAPAAGPMAETGSARASAAATAVGPKFVDAANLAKAPRAPPLDTSLEKNYPPEARRSRISGGAILRLQILPDGRIRVVRRVSETYTGFAEACERTVKAGTWEPPMDREGRPVATEITFMCRFEVKG